MSNKLFVVIFLCILLVGFFFRFYKLGDIPSSLDWDEVSQGYNAYSISTTGKDEFGTSYPHTIRSFNDYKPPIYVYLTTLSVKFFGLSSFSVRFPSALFGSLSILLVYGLIYEIFRKEIFSKKIALFSMFFFSISPMSIQFSRTGFDANVAIFFVLLGSWLIMRFLAKEIIWPIFVGVLFLGISVYTAHSEKIFTPLLFVYLLFHGKKFLFRRKIILIGLIVFFAFLNIFWFLDQETKVRSKGVLFTSSPDLLKTSINESVFDKENNDSLSALIHNRRFVYINKYIENYLSHFNPNSLFISGDNPRHHAPEMGVLYLISLPFILLGVFFAIRRKMHSSYILFAWIVIAPVASSFAINAPNYQRSLIFLPAFHVFEALGWFYFFSLISKVKFSSFYVLLALMLLIFNIFYYLHQYFIHTNTDYAKYWQYGYKEAINFVNTNIDIKKRIFFANDIEQGYIFYLFYNGYSPKKYLAESGSNRVSSPCYSINNAYFGQCKDLVRKGDIYITSKGDKSSEFKGIKKINYSNDETAVEIFEHL